MIVKYDLLGQFPGYKIDSLKYARGGYNFKMSKGKDVITGEWTPSEISFERSKL